MANANSYEVGTTVRVSVAFTDASGAAADPTTVTGSILVPGALAAAALTVVKDSVGNYHADYTPAAQGVYRYKFVGAGAINAGSESVFTAVLGF